MDQAIKRCVKQTLPHRQSTGEFSFKPSLIDLRLRVTVQHPAEDLALAVGRNQPQGLTLVILQHRKRAGHKPFGAPIGDQLIIIGPGKPMSDRAGVGFWFQAHHWARRRRRGRHRHVALVLVYVGCENPSLRLSGLLRGSQLGANLLKRLNTFGCAAFRSDKPFGFGQLITYHARQMLSDAILLCQSSGFGLNGCLPTIANQTRLDRLRPAQNRAALRLNDSHHKLNRMDPANGIACLLCQRMKTCHFNLDSHRHSTIQRISSQTHTLVKNRLDLFVAVTPRVAAPHDVPRRVVKVRF
mmetsp:Transcript_12659/g.20151  ORF Transcript_12659/g.20151 Transcript_12659/m.20151 type:complete len:298 (+) Transcript_12659:338-1231(+)